jgi:hypothetical protein
MDFYPPQLTPVQAWLLGYFDTNTLRDLLRILGDQELCESFGRAVCDEAYASSLMAEAQDLLERDVVGVGS